MQYEVREEDGHFKVYHTETNKPITTEVPTREIAQEIADDFNAMSRCFIPKNKELPN